MTHLLTLLHQVILAVATCRDPRFVRGTYPATSTGRPVAVFADLKPLKPVLLVEPLLPSPPRPETHALVVPTDWQGIIISMTARDRDRSPDGRRARYLRLMSALQEEST